MTYSHIKKLKTIDPYREKIKEQNSQSISKKVYIIHI
jgi:hypothetical protein